jgi:hypothetical protein
VTVAAILTLIGIAAIALGSEWNGTGGTVVTSIGTILVTVALLGFLYDTYLKEVLLGEIYAALDLQQDIRAIDLRQIVRKEALDLASLLGDTKSLTVIPLDPETWSRTDWQQVLELSARQQLEVTVLLPDHDSPHIDVLARRLGIDREDLALIHQ